MRLRWGLFLLLGCSVWARGQTWPQGQAQTRPQTRSQARPAVEPPDAGVRCRGADVELYEGGSSAALGHSERVIQLRNRSQRTCTMLGSPEVVFFDDYSKRLPGRYGRNSGDYMFTSEPVQLVTLQPGEFAHFKIETTSCSEQAECLHFSRMDVVLPGDNAPLTVARSPSNVTGINVSAVGAGADTGEGGWVPPTATVAVASGTLPGLSLRLDVPASPVEGFTAHFSLRNAGADPVQLGARTCVLGESLTNSADATVAAKQNCAKWMGALGSDGRLAPGSVATMDLSVAGDSSDNTRGKLCRAGPWKAELELATDAGKVRFQPVSFVVKTAQCSDSDELTSAGAEDIRWTLIPQRSARLGVLVRAKGNTEPSDGRYFSGISEPAFRVGESIELRLFLDNMTDEPIRLNAGPGAFRLLVRRAGLNVSPDLVAPARTQQDGPAKEVTVPPHSQKEIGMRRLNDTYDLAEGDYQLSIGALHLEGAASTADASATNPTSFEDSATAGGLIKVVP
jgi:Protein of unknown function (DUF4232)